MWQIFSRAINPAPKAGFPGACCKESPPACAMFVLNHQPGIQGGSPGPVEESPPAWLMFSMNHESALKAAPLSLSKGRRRWQQTSLHERLKIKHAIRMFV